MKYNIVTRDGEVVHTANTKHEAAQRKLELVAYDVAKGTYEQGFYQIVEQKGKRK